MMGDREIADAGGKALWRDDESIVSSAFEAFDNHDGGRQ
jgi:hypothetical protein